MSAAGASPSPRRAPRYAVLFADAEIEYGSGRMSDYVEKYMVPDALVDKVNTALEAGATLVGGVSAVAVLTSNAGSVHRMRWTQAVVYPPTE
jgi:hypothetical protein